MMISDGEPPKLMASLVIADGRTRTRGEDLEHDNKRNKQRNTVKGFRLEREKERERDSRQGSAAEKKRELAYLQLNDFCLELSMAGLVMLGAGGEICECAPSQNEGEAAGSGGKRPICGREGVSITA